MSKRESNIRQNLLIAKLQRRPMDFKEIQNYLQKQEFYHNGDKLTCSLRTFQRDVQEIASFYHIEIKYDRSANVYRIEDDGLEERNDRVVESFEILNALQISKSLSGKMILERRKPLGTEHLHGLLHAINQNLEIKFSYEKFYVEEVKLRTVKPIAIKEARNRWYLLAEEDGTVKSFGLDRIKQLEFTSTKFEPVDYNAEEDYQYSFGIINAVEKEPQRIILSFTPEQARYINSLPLHHSQQLIFQNEKESRFEYFIYPSYDFLMEILSFGSAAKVLEPAGFKKKVKETLIAAIQQYN